MGPVLMSLRTICLNPLTLTSSPQSCEAICCFSFPPSTPVWDPLLQQTCFSLLGLNLPENYLLALTLMFRTLCMYIKNVLESQVEVYLVYNLHCTVLNLQEIKADHLKIDLKERT